MKKKHIALALAAALLLTSVPTMGVAYAATNEYSVSSPRSIISTSISFVAASRTKGNVSINAQSSITADSIASKVTLQSAPLNSTNFSNVSGVSPETRTVTNALSITHKCSFPITADKEYRIKVEITEVKNGVTLPYTYYHGLTI